MLCGKEDEDEDEEDDKEEEQQQRRSSIKDLTRHALLKVGSDAAAPCACTFVRAFTHCIAENFAHR